MKLWQGLLIGLAGLGLVGGAGFAGGALLVHKKHPLYVRASQVWDQRKAEGEKIPTALLDLRIERISIPASDRPVKGGGLASHGDELLLLTHDGRIFSIIGNTPHPTALTPPDNGYAAYKKAVADGRWPDVVHWPELVRYHDVLAYEEKGQAYLVASYMEVRGDCYGNAVARTRLDRGRVLGQKRAPADWTVVYRSTPCLPVMSKGYIAFDGHPAGGRMQRTEGHRILLTNGDFMWDGAHNPRPFARDMGNDYGKVVEVDLETGAHRIVARGLRNPQGIVRRNDGEIFTVGHGHKGGDELNHIVEGEDYGFPATSIGILYTNDPWPQNEHTGRHEVGTPPVYAWVPSIGPSNLKEVRGFHPDWDGDLLVGSMAAQALFRMRVVGEQARYVEPIEIGERIRYLQMHRGRIALWTDSGNILFLSPVAFSATRLTAEAAIADLKLGAAEPKVRATLDQCLSCHTLNPAHGMGPSLWKVMDRDIASAGFAYSPALQQTPGRWTEENLRRFLADSRKFAPGSTMPRVTLSKEEQDGVVAVLKRTAEIEAW